MTIGIRTRATLVGAVVILTLTTAGALTAAAQEAGNVTRSSYDRARRVLDAGVEAAGGLARLRAADRVTIEYHSAGHRVGQNSSYTAPPKVVPIAESRTMIDYGGQRYYAEGLSKSPGGYIFRFRTVVTPRQSFAIDILRNRSGNTINRLSPTQQESTRRGALLEVPHLLLLNALDRAESLRWVGETRDGGRAYQVISYAAEDAAQLSIFFDDRTKLLARYELLGSSPLLGDTLTTGFYHEYQTISGVKVPKRRVVLQGGSVVTEAVYDRVTFEFDAGGGLLEVPAGYVEVSPPPAAAPVRRLGDGVYLIEGGLPTNYRMMFVEFTDHVMVLEAPQNAAVAQAAIALIRKTVPDKSIRYLGFSHFHFDHTGGLRQFIGEGATVVVPPGNSAFVEAIARSRFALRRDALALKPAASKVETFEGKRVFTDGSRTVEFHSIGPTSHVDDMVIFYFPKEKVLFQGDMFSQVESGGMPPIIEVHRELVRKVRELGLEVETLIGVHGGALQWRTFHEAVEGRRP